MDEVVIHFHPDGTARCLWNDQLDLLQLGELQVERASEIEFNHTYQRWEIRTPYGGLITGFISRSDAIECEVAVLQWKMKLKE